MNAARKRVRVLAGAVRGIERAAPLFDLGLRLYVANVFFKSGLVKIQSWDRR